MAEPLTSLRRLAADMGVATRYTDGLGRRIEVGTDTLLATCRALGAPLERVDDAPSALDSLQAEQAGGRLAPVLTAWDGALAPVAITAAPGESFRAALLLEDGGEIAPEADSSPIRFPRALPFGYHRLRIEFGDRTEVATVIAAPIHSWHPDAPAARWGISAQLAALRSARSRSCGDLRDLAAVAEWVGGRGGDLVTLLPLLPTFNDPPAEPSPYSPVSRLFWSELVLDLGADHRPVTIGSLLDVGAAEQEVRAALAGRPAVDSSAVDDELARYAAFRGAQTRLGRDWRRWPGPARDGVLTSADVDPTEERFHLVAQTEVRRQLVDLRRHLDDVAVGLGLDLAVGVHPAGYDVWSRPDLFAAGMSVGAPPDGGFPSGQSWGFPPILPDRSREEGHAYVAASVAHQAALAGVLRVDHVMAMRRLYWIPDGMDKADGTYVDYPVEELFAVLCLESHRNRCEIVGENLGTVPAEIDEALPRHRIWGMYLGEFAAGAKAGLAAPTADEVAMIGTHDTPTFAGWVAGVDIEERVALGLLAADAAPKEHTLRARAARSLAKALDGDVHDVDALLSLVVDFLGESPSPIVMMWLEDLWLETRPVNVPGSSSADRPNWQRPLDRLLDEVLVDPQVTSRLDRLDEARHRSSLQSGHG